MQEIFYLNQANRISQKRIFDYHSCVYRDQKYGIFSRWKLEGVEDRIGKTSLVELKDLCAHAELVIANDSGVAHLSSTLAGARTLVVFGPGNPTYIAPQGPKMVPVLANPKVVCSPCEKAYCRAPFGYQKCLKDISVETVLKQIETTLPL
jgi:ADP-heptose:LPS heptosyltransferase